MKNHLRSERARQLDFENKIVRINGEYLSHIRHSHYVLIFSNNPEKLEDKVKISIEESIKVGLKISLEKAKILFTPKLKIV